MGKAKEGLIFNSNILRNFFRPRFPIQSLEYRCEIMRWALQSKPTYESQYGLLLTIMKLYSRRSEFSLFVLLKELKMKLGSGI